MDKQRSLRRHRLILILGGLCFLLATWVFLIPKAAPGSTRAATLGEDQKGHGSTDRVAPAPRAGKQRGARDAVRIQIQSENDNPSAGRALSLESTRSDVVGVVPQAEVSFRPLSLESVKSIGGAVRKILMPTPGGKPTKVITDAQGMARVSLDPQREYQVSAKALGFIALGFPVVLKKGATALRIPFTRSLQVEGRVLTPDGEAVAGAGLSFCAASNRFGGSARVDSWGHATTDAKGRFLLESQQEPAGSEIYIAVSHQDYEPLLEKLPPQRAHSYLELRMRSGIRFRFRALDRDGNPVPDVRLMLTQGRYRKILNTRPSGHALDGNQKGLRSYPSLRTSRFGIAVVRGWPVGEPAWLSYAPPIEGASIIPDFRTWSAKPNVHGRALRGVVEFDPRQDQVYDLYVVAQDQETLIVEGSAPGFTLLDKKMFVLSILYGPGKSKEIPFRVTWRRDSFRGILIYERKFIEKDLSPEDLRKTFWIRVMYGPALKSQEILGPYQLLVDRRIQGVSIKRGR